MAVAQTLLTHNNIMIPPYSVQLIHIVSHLLAVCASGVEQLLLSVIIDGVPRGGGNMAGGGMGGGAGIGNTARVIRALVSVLTNTAWATLLAMANARPMLIWISSGRIAHWQNAARRPSPGEDTRASYST